MAERVLHLPEKWNLGDFRASGGERQHFPSEYDCLIPNRQLREFLTLFPMDKKEEFESILNSSEGLEMVVGLARNLEINYKPNKRTKITINHTKGAAELEVGELYDSGESLVFLIGADAKIGLFMQDHNGQILPLPKPLSDKPDELSSAKAFLALERLHCEVRAAQILGNVAEALKEIRATVVEEMAQTTGGEGLNWEKLLTRIADIKKERIDWVVKQADKRTAMAADMPELVNKALVRNLTIDALVIPQVRKIKQPLINFTSLLQIARESNFTCLLSKHIKGTAEFLGDKFINFLGFLLPSFNSYLLSPDDRLGSIKKNARDAMVEGIRASGLDPQLAETFIGKIIDTEHTL